jgi:hypothetical protein
MIHQQKEEADSKRMNVSLDIDSTNAILQQQRMSLILFLPEF